MGIFWLEMVQNIHEIFKNTWLREKIEWVTGKLTNLIWFDILYLLSLLSLLGFMLKFQFLIFKVSISTG